ncbi:MAG: molybdenum ABC transporter ATP-binding protein [Acidisphaera sp.]|nr:molybdenum ABC transporter ATP-binding protein [Acidisphaera sp.]
MTLSLAFRHAFPGLALDIAFDAPTPGTTVLFGPSGAGKSTAAAVVAGLLRPLRGRVAIDGTVLADSDSGRFLPPERRRVGLVFQEARLFPHISVLGNLRYGLRRAPADTPQRIELAQVIDLLGLAALLARRPGTLSGGERQRVAIGRALLSQPRLLVMDEPLASLDAPRKAEILPYLARLKTTLALPILYITHALEEVSRLADTLVLIEAGRSLAAGPLADIVSRGDLPLAARDDAAAILFLRVTAHDPARRLTCLQADGLMLLVPLLASPPGTALRVRVPAREVILATEIPGGISVHNILPGEVRAVTEDAARHAALVEVALGSASALLARVTPDAVARLCLGPGAPVLALVKSMAVEVLV